MLKFCAFLFYRFYLRFRASRDSAYIRTIGALALLTFLHFLQFLILVGGMGILPSGHKREVWTWVKMMLFGLPFYFLFMFFIKEKDLVALTYPERKVKRGNVILVVYMILSMAFLIFLIETSAP